MNTYRAMVYVVLTVGLFLAAPVTAHAGFLDKLKSATDALNQKAQQNQGTAAYSGGGSLSAGLGATSVNTDFPTCMQQTSGVHEKLTAQVLQRKLPTLSSKDRKTAQEDIDWLNATGNGQRIPAPDPKNSQRYLLLLTDDEQGEISGATNTYVNEVHEKCEYQYGGMSQFGDASGRAAHAPINTHIPLPDLLHATPAPAQNVAASKPHSNNCMALVQGVRWKIMADMMEQKMNGLHNLSANDKKGWEEDIALVRSMENGNVTTMPRSPDPQNPMRYMSRLDVNEQMKLNQEYATQSHNAMTTCMNAGRTPEQDQRSSELAAMHEARRKQQQDARNGIVATSDLDVSALSAIKGEWGNQETCKQNSSTCGNGMDDISNCMHQTQNYFYRLVTAALQQKLNKGNNLSSRDRSSMQTDIAQIKQAMDQGEVEGPNAKLSQHWLTWLTPQDQQVLRQLDTKYTTAVHDDCDARFASLSHYSGTGGR